MTVLYRGLTIHIRGDDPRAQEVARLLFGPVAQAPAAEPAVPPLSKAARDFWHQASRLQLESLERLSTGPRRRAWMLWKLRVNSVTLMGAHSGLNRVAARHGLPIRVETGGRLRTRFHRLQPEAMALVKRMLVELPR